MRKYFLIAILLNAIFIIAISQDSLNSKTNPSYQNNNDKDQIIEWDKVDGFNFSKFGCIHRADNIDSIGRIGFAITFGWGSWRRPIKDVNNNPNVWTQISNPYELYLNSVIIDSVGPIVYTINNENIVDMFIASVDKTTDRFIVVRISNKENPEEEYYAYFSWGYLLKKTETYFWPCLNETETIVYKNTYNSNIVDPFFIKRIQRRLVDMGFMKGEIDGKMGPLTRKSLSEYQSIMKLKYCGNLGEFSQSELVDMCLEKIDDFDN